MMLNSTRIVVALGGAFALLAIAVPAFARGGQSGPTGARFSHLYVADQHILRYPLVDGKPSGVPDAEITTVITPTSIAVGPDGELYATQAGYPVSYVDVFAPRSRGKAKPLRVLNAPLYPQSVAVDANGYLYVATSGWSGLAYVDVFAPNAFGAAQPVQTIFLPGPHIEDVALDAAGNLYVGTYDGQYIYVFATPATKPMFVRELCQQTDAYFPNGIAISADGFEYASFNASISVFRDTLNACPPPSHGEITIAGQPPQGLGGVAVQNGHLFVASNYPGGAIYELDAHRLGVQTPLATISGPKSKLLGPRDVIVGP
jgi:DNA-binding beta-propeller fold protein YncE